MGKSWGHGAVSDGSGVVRSEGFAAMAGGVGAGVVGASDWGNGVPGPLPLGHQRLVGVMPGHRRLSVLPQGGQGCVIRCLWGPGSAAMGGGQTAVTTVYSLLPPSPFAPVPPSLEV